MVNNAEDSFQDLGVLGDVLHDMRARLQPGGPEVDEATLCAYIAGALADDERQRVARQIETWRAWFEAYWKVCAEVDAGELALREADAKLGSVIAPMDVWLAAPLMWQQLKIHTTVACGAAILLLALGQKLAIRSSRGRSGENDTDTGQECRLSLTDLEDLLARGPVTLKNKEQWLHLTVDEAGVRLRVGKSPGDRFQDFRIEFRRGNDTVVYAEAERGILTLKEEHFAAATTAGADSLSITIGKE